MSDENFGLVQTLIEEFGKASLMDRIGFLVTMAAFFSSPVFYFFWRQYRLEKIEKQELDNLCKTRAELIRKQKREIDELTKTINEQKSWFLDVRLRKVKKERQDGYEEHAINLLRTGVEAIRPDLATCCYELALHHLSLLPDYGVKHLLEAERMARIATLLYPSDQEIRSLLAEILAIESGVESDRSNYLASDNLWDEAFDFLESGNNPQETIIALVNTATQCYKRGQYRFAERMYRRALMMSRRIKNFDKKSILFLRNEQAVSLGASGKYSDALELFNALLPDQEKVLGKDHLNTLITRNNIASYTEKMGDAKRALELFNALLPDQENVLGKDHPETLRTRSYIAGYAGEMGDAKRALELFNALLPDQEKVLGKDHPENLRVRSWIAYYTGEMGDAKRALELFIALLPDYQKVLGKDHPETLITRSHIASWTGEAGDVKRALELLNALLPDQEKVLGKDHPVTLRTFKQVEHWQSIVDRE
ncbi:Tetratricopeptide repeat-containing protein [Nitrosomonas aestuarii]|uniref:Tetratricopeptide repeat-containing protein n=1 Tax=Nitrosomonas aestuarii TaxID=52441 RepID=A0A1I4EWU9_9PROT|nr:tetratricopeptide repeat protein [Nitrosomonas aestuarii]SFL09590.1 Tetratricopeptide repeat-containing protein [Nitrosomonas aestuarii]